MKAKLIPIYFQSARDREFVKGVEHLKRFFSQEADILEPYRWEVLYPKQMQ